MNYSSMKEKVMKLYKMQLSYGGIPESAFHFLPKKEREMLEEKEGRFFLKEEYRKKITVVLTGGVFDILHFGHIYTLDEAKKHGDVLVVAVARDDHIKNKRRKLIHSQEYRAKMVEFLKPVDVAMLGKDKPGDLLEFVSPDVLVFGYDQEVLFKPVGVEIIKLAKHVEEKKFKTSRIIEELGV
jgi:cytidyltransferase-like protein